MELFITNAQRMSAIQHLLQASSLLTQLEKLETYCKCCGSKKIVRFASCDLDAQAYASHLRDELELNSNN